MTRQYCALFIIFLLIISTAQSQNNLLKGYYIKLEGDTVRGYIDYKNWSYSPKTIAFTTEIIGEKRELTVNEVREFTVAGETFVAASFRMISSNYKRVENTSPNPTIIEKQGFLRELVRGTKSLYMYKGQDGLETFYYLYNNSYVLLEYNRYSERTNGQLFLKENRKFVGQLIVYLNGCENIGMRVNKIDYSRKEIENVFLSYYKCIDQSPVNYKQKEKWTINYGIYAGIRNTSISFNGSNKEYLTEGTFRNHLSYVAGFNIETIQSGNQKRWAGVGSVSFSSIKLFGEYTDVVSSNTFHIYDTFIEYRILKLSGIGRYYLLNDKLKVYGGVGLVASLNFINTNYVKIESHIFSNISYNEIEALEYYNVFTLGALANIGTRYRNFGLEARFSSFNDISDYKSIHSNVNNLDVFLIYWF